MVDVESGGQDGQQNEKGDDDMLGEEVDGGGGAERTGEAATGQQSLAHDVGHANLADRPGKRARQRLMQEMRREKRRLDADAPRRAEAALREIDTDL